MNWGLGMETGMEMGMGMGMLFCGFEKVDRMFVEECL